MSEKLFLSLAPMEGVMDSIFRDLITTVGGVDQVTTEFMRVTRYLHPIKVFERYAPELKTQSRTKNGTPLFIQFLGGQPEPMAMNAARAVELGAYGIDLNFGCPAKTVNRHDGGASLLKSPKRLYDITKAVRAAVIPTKQVTAKMRLGFDDPSLCVENARALEEGGASSITVHCRTKVEGYRPPAHWEWICKIREAVKIPIVANGDIEDLQSLLKCREITGCDRFMIGRGALKNPFIFSQLRAGLETPAEWEAQRELILNFYFASRDSVNEYFATARTKQFLRNLTLASPQAREVFLHTKTLMKPREFFTELRTRLG